MHMHSAYLSRLFIRMTCYGGGKNTFVTQNNVKYFSSYSTIIIASEVMNGTLGCSYSGAFSKSRIDFNERAKYTTINKTPASICKKIKIVRMHRENLLSRFSQ